ncbi:MAG: TIR domain-containing protein [Vicinamibacterales bacterium]
MAHLFISYASPDQAVATDVCALLEAQGVTCWIAPRDVAAGKVWDEAILDAIEGASAFLLILSSHSNASPFVKNEVNRAFSLQKPIVTFRVEDVMPGRSLELYLARHHWTDGFTGRIEDQAAQLAASVTALMGPSAADAAGGVAAGTPAPAKATGKPASKARLVTRASRRERVAWGVAAVAVIAAVVASALAVSRWGAAESGAPGPGGLVYRTSINPPPDTMLSSVTVSFRFALSPDGRMLAFVATGEGGQRVWLRRLDAETATPLPGTENGLAPFWSPDSHTVGFFDNTARKLKRVDVAGGAAQVVCDYPGSAAAGGASWGPTGVIVFGTSNDGLFRVPAAGGAPERVVALDREAGEQALSMPWFLPDGQHVLFTARMGDSATTYIGSRDGGDRMTLLKSAAGVKYTQGHLVYTREGTLVAQPFDAGRLMLTGEPVPLAEYIATGGASGRQGALTASNNGALAYQRGDASVRRLTWIDRSGRELGTIGGFPASPSNLALSRDGRHVAVNAGGDIWTADLTRSVVSRLTFDSALDSHPIWSPDGQRVVFYSVRGGTPGLYEKSANGGGEERRLVGGTSIGVPRDWSADGRFILYDAADATSGADVGVLDLAGGQTATPLLHGPFAESGARFSPDGRWIAYQSDESGALQIYVQSFPRTGAKWQVSAAGGQLARWRPDGEELFYLDGEQLMSVPVQTVPTFTPGTPVPVVKVGRATMTFANNMYGVSADGQRFLVNMNVAGQAAEITLVTNWPALLKQP